MKHTLKAFACLAGIIPILYGCGNGDDAFSTPGTGGGDTNESSTPPENVVSQKGITLLFSPVPEVYDNDGNYTLTTSTLTVNLSDRNNIAVTGSHTVYFRTEWGSFDFDSCVTVNGTCTVNWTSGKPSEVPSDKYIFFIAYTLGEEEFTDVNDNGVYDNGDVHQVIDDLVEPFIDCDHNGFYSDGSGTTPNSALPDPTDPAFPLGATFDVLEAIIDVHTQNGIHDDRDNRQSSPDCQHPSNCSASPLIMIYDVYYVDVTQEDNSTFDSPLTNGQPLLLSTCNN